MKDNGGLLSLNEAPTRKLIGWIKYLSESLHKRNQRMFAFYQNGEIDELVSLLTALGHLFHEKRAILLHGWKLKQMESVIIISRLKKLISQSYSSLPVGCNG